MLQFRTYQPGTTPGDVTDLLAISGVIDDVLRAGNYFVSPDLHLTWIAARAETIAWEVFRGRLLDGKQTRLQKSFLSWHIIEANDTHPATEPTISVKLDVHDRCIHVTRAFLAYAWEGYDAGGVIETREVVQWTRELVGTMLLRDFTDLDSVRDELICLVWQAIVGASRLPLISVEAPLPAFSFGQLHYVYQASTSEQPCSDWRVLLAHAFGDDRNGCEPHKVIEFILRRLPHEDVDSFVRELWRAPPHGWAVGEITEYWRRMFNDVSLSPYTSFVSNALTVLDVLAEKELIGIGQRLRFLSHLLRKLGRHLTAYDLVTFHHRGANYPDALLLDELLKRFLHGIECHPDRFLGSDAKPRMLRRALRQAFLLRRHYEGHLVPDAPTSPGENARVMPANMPRVGEEQLVQVTRRSRRLFADDPLSGRLTPLVRMVFAQSIADLEHVEERTEMGIGLFIDRPLGYAKQVGEPDLTPLLAHEALSPSIARRRWAELKNLCAEVNIETDLAKLEALFASNDWPTGLPHDQVAECPRPVAALCDVRKVASDFVILRTALTSRIAIYNSLNVDFRRVRLCIPATDAAGHPVIALYDESLRRSAELRVDVSQGFITRAGVELPRAGVRVSST